MDSPAKAEINRYFDAIQRRLPVWVCRYIQWLRRPTSFWARLIVAILLVVGGIFSFLPILGLWMLPLGFLLIAQDIPVLQKPLVSALSWVEAKWNSVTEKWKPATRNSKR